MKGIPSLILTALFCLAAPDSSAAKANTPSLLFELDDVPQIRERINSTQWLKGAFKYSVLEAVFFLQTVTQPYSLTSPGDKKTGITGNGIGTAGRSVQHQLATLGFVGYVTGEQKYLDKGKELLLAVIRQTEPDTHKHWINALADRRCFARTRLRLRFFRTPPHQGGKRGNA